MNGKCGLCHKPEKEHGSCEYHIVLFTTEIEKAVDMAQSVGLNEDESVAYIESRISVLLKNEALKYRRPGEYFTPESFKITRVKMPEGESGVAGAITLARDDHEAGQKCCVITPDPEPPAQK